MVRVVQVYYEFSGLFSGNVNDDIDFEYGEGTDARYGCGATLFGQFWYFGGNGSSLNRQVWHYHLFSNQLELIFNIF